MAIASVLPPHSVLHCVDHFRGSPEHSQMGIDTSSMFAQFRANIESFGVADRIEVHVTDTVSAADEFVDGSVDLLLVDGSHDYESVRQDLGAWYVKLASNGVLFCDDYDPQWPGVMQAVDELQLKGQVVCRALWCHRKT